MGMPAERQAGVARGRDDSRRKRRGMAGSTGIAKSIPRIRCRGSAAAGFLDVAGHVDVHRRPSFIPNDA